MVFLPPFLHNACAGVGSLPFRARKNIKNLQRRIDEIYVDKVSRDFIIKNIDMSFFYNNKNTIRIFFLVIFLFGKSGVGLYGQTITGIVTDKETKEELIFASISIFENKKLIVKGNTDIDGNYNIELEKGIYDIEVSYTGYPSEKIVGIILNENQMLEINFQLEVKVFLSDPFPLGYKVPVLKKEKVKVAKIENLEATSRRPRLNFSRPLRAQ